MSSPADAAVRSLRKAWATTPRRQLQNMRALATAAGTVNTGMAESFGCLPEHWGNVLQVLGPAGATRAALTVLDDLILLRLRDGDPTPEPKVRRRALAAR